MSKNFYEILQVDISASSDEIKKSYRRLAMKYHPDRTQNNKEKEEVFKQIKQAYETLIDENKRTHYDWELNLKKKEENNHTFENKFSFHKQHETKKNNFVYQGKPFFHYELNCSFEDIYFGRKKIISLMIENQVMNLEVLIPQGISDQDFFIVEYANFFMKYIIIYEEHIFFKRDGLDIHAKISVDFFDAILGANKKLNFKIISREFEYTLPPYTQNGQKIIIKNGGFKKDFLIGNLVLDVNILMPTYLSQDMLKMIENHRKRGQLQYKILKNRYFIGSIFFIIGFIIGQL